MKKYSLESGRIFEYDSEAKPIEELSEFYEEIMRRNNGDINPNFNESHIYIHLQCNSSCTSEDVINDASDEKKERVRKIVRNYVHGEKDSGIPYIIYLKRSRKYESICLECIQTDETAYWRVLRAKQIESADIEYLVRVLKNLDIYDLQKI